MEKRDAEKTPFLGEEEQEEEPASSSPSRSIATYIFLAAWLSVYVLAFRYPFYRPWSSHHDLPMPDDVVALSQCKQVPALYPKDTTEGLDKMSEYISSQAFRNSTIDHLSKAVQIATESFDDLGEIGKDKRWDVMYDFADYLESTFPLIHSNLKVEKVNTHGLLYTWNGTDESLKPTLLMAHQDVVPVPAATVDAWTHPPFSGYYDGKYVWGRGASDCKNQLIAIMETVELFLKAGYQPKRSIVLSFGFDEEVSGPQGAGHLAKYLLERYGKDGIAALVDEGATFEDVWGTSMAKPGVAEKGYTDVYINVRMPGGHSSIPTDHTSIGVAAEIITKIEEVQYELELTQDNPYLAQLYCGAEHSPDFPKKLKKLLHQSSHSTCPAAKKHKHDALAKEAAKIGPAIKYLMQTSQAVDVISGGVKVNALPERTVVTVNHRINLGSAPEAVYKHLTKIVTPIAKKYGLELHAFDGTEEAAKSISLSAGKATLDVAPVTPTKVDSVTPYSVLAATIRAVYGEEVIVSPGIMTGNTDTRYYWDLTDHIFRYGPGYDPEDGGGLGNIHTVDEKVSVVNHINAVKWFTLFIRNMDDAQL